MSRIIANNIRHNDATSDNLALDGSGRVGIGSSPTRPLTVAAGSGETVNILGVFDSSNANPSTVSNCVIAFSDPTSTGGQFSTRLGSVGDSLAFYTNGANERMRILSSGGVTFNGDTAAANALDDYEEGTYTVTITPNSGSIALQWWGSAATYTKIGNVIHACGIVTVQGNTSATGFYRINLPFASNSVEGTSVYVTFDNLATGYTTNSFNADISAGQNSIRVWNGTGTSVSTTGAAAQALQNGTEIKFSATYTI